VDAVAKKKLVWGLVVVLFLVRYDFWYWDDRTLVIGFLPIGLFYHMVLSVLAGVCWFLVIKYAWPSHVEEWADANDDGGNGGDGSGGAT
jgi:hypothetical protein